MKASMSKVYYFYCCSIALFLSVAAQAQIIHLPGNDMCSRYSGDAQACIRNNDCDYNFNNGRCSRNGSGGGGGGGHQDRCSVYDNNANRCETTIGCQYDYRDRQCVADNFNDDDNHNNRCSDYDNNANRCNQTRDCQYDYRNRQCNDSFDNNDNRIQTTTHSCDSNNYRYAECRVRGQVISVDLIRQDSSSACTLGRSYGETSDGIWVDHGCRGTFRVRYRY